MALVPLDDLVGVSLTEHAGPTQILTWETATDWDNAVSESRVEHTTLYGNGDAEVRLGASEDNGDVSEWYVPTGQTAPGVHEARTTQTKVGPYARYRDSSGSSNDYDVTAIDMGANVQIPELSFWFYGNNPSAGSWYYAPRIWTLDNTQVHAVALDGGTGSGRLSYLGNSGWQSTGWTFPSNTWFKVRCVYDWAGNSWDLYGGGSARATNISFLNSVSGIGSYHENAHYSTTYNDDPFYIDHLLPFYFSGSLTTATKTFPTTQQPGLTGLDYDLNGGGITLTVIGSPGSGSEEQVSQVLDGASSYSLSWASGHTDFRVKMDLSPTTNNDETPAFRAVSLQ